MTVHFSAASILDNVVTGLMVAFILWLSREMWVYMKRRAREAKERAEWQDKMLNIQTEMQKDIHALSNRYAHLDVRVDRHEIKLAKIAQQLIDKK